MEIRDRIKEIRTTIGLSQAKFAERIAVAASLISEVEGGVRAINERAIRLIIAEFNVNESWLRTGQGSMFNDEVNASVSESVAILRSLDQQFQDGALKILTVLGDINEKINSLYR